MSRPEDDALDRLDDAMRGTVYQPDCDCRDCADLTRDFATVREALERQREEQDITAGVVDELTASTRAHLDRVESAEAEVRQLREERDELQQINRDWFGLQERERRLTEGLREIAKDDDLVEANEGAFSIHAYRRCRDLARALLSASPSDGGGA